MNHESIGLHVGIKSFYLYIFWQHKILKRFIVKFLKLDSPVYHIELNLLWFNVYFFNGGKFIS